jgi:hypothetical protein
MQWNSIEEVAGRLRIGGSGSPFDLLEVELPATACSLALCTSLHRLQGTTHGWPNAKFCNVRIGER